MLFCKTLLLWCGNHEFLSYPMAGKEVALYCASNLARMITTTEAYASCDLEAALRKAFMECDAKLLTKETIKEMKKFIMGHVSDDEEAE